MVKDATHHPDYKVIHFVIFSLLLNYLILIELFLAQSLFSYQLVALIFVIIILWSSIVVILMCNLSGVLSRGECGKRIVRSSSREILKKIAATFWSKVDEYIVVLNLQDIILFGQFFGEEQYFGDWCINTTLATSSCHIVNIGHLSWSGHLLAIQCLVQQNVSLEPSWRNKSYQNNMFLTVHGNFHPCRSFKQYFTMKTSLNSASVLGFGHENLFLSLTLSIGQLEDSVFFLFTSYSGC